MIRPLPLVDPPRVRLLKYAVLIGFGLLHLWLIAIFYSNYTTRRAIEEGLAQTSGGATFETLLFDARSGADIVREVERQRCLQRDQITLYRLASMSVRSELSSLFAATQPMRVEILAFARKHPDIFDPTETETNLGKVWGLPLISDLKLRNPFSPIPDGARTEFNDALARITASLSKELAKEGTLAGLVAELGTKAATPDEVRPIVARQWKEWADLDRNLFRITNLDALETALSRLNKEYDRVGLTNETRRNFLIRRLAADDLALPAGSEPNLLGEFLTSVEGARKAADLFQHLACSELDDTLRATLVAAAQPLLKADAKGADAKGTSTPAEALWAAYGLVRASAAALRPGTPVNPLVATFVRASTSTQTLVIAMLFGSLGAICLQGLRLSRAGYWGSQSDPYWGEILMSIVLGMAAALIVYVLASIGNQIISDQSRPAQGAPVGAGLVALLGFVSGLLNDDAFGRIRRFGQGWFRSDTGYAAGLPLTGVDAEFVTLLRDAGLARFSDVALIHLAGSRLAAKERFTLFVPRDDWFDRQSLSVWRGLVNATNSKEFDRFLDAHLTVLGTLDADELQALAKVSGSVTTADGTERKVTVAAPGGVAIDGRDIDLGCLRAWRGGVIVPVATRL